MDLSLSTKRAELIELEKTIRRRQKLLDLTSREIEESMLKLEEEKKAMEKKEGPSRGTGQLHSNRDRTRKPNCEEGRSTWAAGHGGIYPLRAAGSIRLGGVTSILVIMAKA
jgi:hypothetical protein